MGRNESASQNWRAWFREYGPRLLLYARQQTRSDADAEDVLQDVVIKLWKNGEANEAPALPRVFLTIRHAAIDRARSADRRKQREEVAAELDEIEFGGGKWFECNLESRERTEMIHEALAKLSDPYREVLSLKIWGELISLVIARSYVTW